jgi:hypothetical protein
VFRDAELRPEALDSYRKIIGKSFAWPGLADFTAKRGSARGCAEPWRGGIPVVFELLSEGFPRAGDGERLRPFSLLRVEAVTDAAVTLPSVSSRTRGGLGHRLRSRQDCGTGRLQFMAQRPGCMK